MEASGASGSDGTMLKIFPSLEMAGMCELSGTAQSEVDRRQMEKYPFLASSSCLERPDLKRISESFNFGETCREIIKGY